MPKISSLLDTDFYKFTMQQAVFFKFTDLHARYAFKLRNPDPREPLGPLADEIEENIMALDRLKMTSEEVSYLEGLPFFTPGYIEFLRYFRMDPSRFVKIGVDDGEELTIDIHGPWLYTILFEVPILSIVSEVWTDNHHPFEEVCDEGRRRLMGKVRTVKEADPWFRDEFRFADFGTRRRHSYAWHHELIETLKRELSGPGNFNGTSNVHLARIFGLKPIGTMAHEFIQACQARVRLSDSQRYAFQTWADVYRGDLGIALSDTLGVDAFLKDFDRYFSKLFDGARQDSGDPYSWGDRIIDHYRGLGIDPMTKSAVFSDGLDLGKCKDILSYFRGRIRTSFGIGTDLTHDMGYTPLQIVVKMTEAGPQNRMRPVAKISDSPGKQMCQDEEYLNYLMTVFNIPRRGGSQ